MGRWCDRSVRRAAARVLLCASVVAAALLPATTASAAGDPGAFFDGPIKYSSIVNCVSIIQGSPYTEYGAGAYVGVYTDADETPPIPAVNQTVYMHVVVYGLGNACSGQRFLPAFDLPSNVSFDTNQPILCFTQSGQAASLSDCPQWDHVSNFPYESGAQAYYSTDSAHANLWPLPQGAFWEFRFPVKSSTTQTSSTLQGYVKMFDGNDSPVLAPKSNLYVFNGAGGSSASVLYDQPSTYASPGTPYGIVSEGRVFTNGQSGTILLQRNSGGTTGFDPDVIQIAVGSGSWRLTTDWDEAVLAPIVANTTYKWRIGFDPDPAGGGDTTWGSTQSFKSLPAATCLGQPITVALQFGQLPTGGDDVIMGTTGADNIDGDAGNDTICGTAGNDTIIGGSGNDRIDGGSGTDTVSYAGTSSAVTVSLATTAAQNTVGAGTDTVTTTENLVGGNGADTLTGSSGTNTISGGAGNDTINGGAGNDVINGGAGNDVISGGSGTDTASYSTATSAVKVSLATTASQSTGGGGTDKISTVENLTGGSGSDTLTGNGGANTLSGGSGNDVLNGGAGNDVISGGSGTDTASYSTATSAVKVSLATTASQSTGGGGTDKISTVENLIGGKGNDTLTGNSGKNTLNGSLGTDTCNGGAGTDTAVSCEAKTGIP